MAPKFVVGIGASAGGLRAVSALLAGVTPDATTAFVLAMHLDPDRTSHMAELLQRTTRLTVVEVRKRTALVADHLYMLAPGFRGKLIGDVLELDAIHGHPGTEMIIDVLFLSMADSQGKRCAGIVLSGGGNDGAAGLRRIMAAGGLALVEDPHEADFDAMPLAALEAISPTAAQTVHAMPLLLADFIAQDCPDPKPALTRARAQAPGPPFNDDVAQLSQLLSDATGVDFSLYKGGTLQRRAERRMLLNGGAWDTYLERLGDDAEELEALYADVLIGVTGFFRDPDAWELLRAELPTLATERSGMELRAWVAGCASGEEAYSLAILLNEYLDGSRRPMQIFATDLSGPALEQARQGLYSAHDLEHVSPARIERYFRKHNGHFRIGAALRETVTFAQHDLLHDAPFSRMDIVSCRNLLIYFKPEAHARVLRNLHFALKRGGLLMTGRSETMDTHGAQFEDVSKGNGLYRAYGDRSTDLHHVSGQAVDQTRRELDLATTQMQSSVKEYRANHEEMLSLNEELLSSNEELEAAKEEQESLNEEMVTINQETAEKNVQLRRANEDLYNLFSSTGIPTIFLDIDLKVRRFTPSVEQVTHLVEADQTRSIEHIKERYEGGQTADTARAVLAEGRTITTEVEVDNGHWYRRVMAPYLSTDGEVCGVCITFEDVTAQKSALRVSDAARAQAESIVRTVRTPVLIVDEQHRIVSVNPAFLRLPGIGNRTIEGMSLEALAVDDVWIYRNISDLVKLVMRKRRPLHDHEIHINGVSLMVNADVMVHGGVAEQVLVALEDVTVHRDFKRASIDRAAEQQAESLRKDEWIALLGHELRNPLGAISTAVSLLSAGIDSEQERQQIVKLMQRQVHQVDVLLDSLLDAARIVAGKLEIVSEPLDLVELLQGVVEAHRLKLKPHQNLQLETPIHSGVIVLGDRTRLIEVADNLLTNASKYTPSRGELRVCVTATEGWGQFSVQDNGVGITVEFMPQIYEMFAQGELGEKTGLGLGLALVKRLVELHEGEIDVHSEGKGCGSEFVVRLPLAAEGSTIAVEEPATATELRRILVVDDDSEAADILIRLLRRLGHEAQSANDGLAALALTADFNPDIVLLDIGMAGMDGYEVATKLRAQSEERHIIALTGYRRDEERLHAAGFNDHLSKPLSTDRLRQALADLDEQQRGS